MDDSGVPQDPFDFDATLAPGSRRPPAHPPSSGAEDLDFDVDSTLVQPPTGGGEVFGQFDMTVPGQPVQPGVPGTPGNPHDPFFPDHTMVGGPAPGPAPAPLPVPTRVPDSMRASPGSRFQILGLLGEGGMGKVFRARDRHIEGRVVALKVLHPRFSGDERFRQLFFQEIHAAQGFVSEHAVQIRDTGQMEDGSLFLTMDLIEGESLDGLLRREGALDPRQAFEITRQVLSGLSGGHEQGLVHRDVKPSNVMLVARVPKTPENPFGVGVRLLDYGVAGLVQEQVVGERTGTPTYMSPEQVQGQRLDARSDLFAVGVVLYEMIAGARPFEGQTLKHVQTSILETQVEPLVRDLNCTPRPVRKLLVKALRKDREKRYQSAGEFARALERSRLAEPAGHLGPGAKLSIGLLAILAGSAATLAYRQFGELRELRGLADSARLDANQTSSEELAALNLSLGQKDTELARLRERLTEEGDLDTRFVDLERDYTKLLEENGALQRRNEELESVRFGQQPSARNAACFDEVLRRIDHGAGRSALDYLKDQSVAGVFALENLDGRDLVYDLAEAAAALEAAQTDGGVNLSQLETADRLLTRVRDGREDFLTEASSWLGLARLGQDTGDRASSLGTTLGRMLATVDTLRERGASRRQSAWDAVASGADDQDPAAAFQHAGLYGADAITPLVARYAAHLEQSLVRDGWLDVDALASSSALSAWAQWLATDGAALDDGAANTIRSFACAYAWYVERADDPVFEELLEIPEVTSSTPHASWRAQLAMQLSLAHGEAYPPAPETTTVMRHTWTQSSSTMFFVERLLENSGDSWTIERRIHDAGGEKTGRPQTYTVTRQGHAFFTEGMQGLDLRSAEESVRVAYLPLDESGSDLPNKSWVRDLDLDGYVAELKSETVPCLIVKTGPLELWFSPRFGLVRESRENVYERQQVFTSAFRQSNRK